MAFEMKLAVAVLRVSGGFNLSSQDLPMELIESNFAKSNSHLSVDSGLDELRDLPPPSPNTLTPPASVAGKQAPDSGFTSIRKTVLDRIGRVRDKTSDQVLTNSTGKEIQNAEVITRMLQFRCQFHKHFTHLSYGRSKMS
jgi:hypothetical protein